MLMEDNHDFSLAIDLDRKVRSGAVLSKGEGAEEGFDGWRDMRGGRWNGLDVFSQCLMRLHV